VNRTFYAFLLLVSSLVGFSTSLYAQVTTSQLTGKVTSAKGENLPGVTVQAVNTSTGARYGAQTMQKDVISSPTSTREAHILSPFPLLDTKKKKRLTRTWAWAVLP